MGVAEGAAAATRPVLQKDINAAVMAGKSLEPNPDGDFAHFRDFLRLALHAAFELASYEAPKLRAIMVSMPAEQQEPKIINQEREPADAQERTERASRAYLTLVKGGRTDAA